MADGLVPGVRGDEPAIRMSEDGLDAARRMLAAYERFATGSPVRIGR